MEHTIQQLKELDHRLFALTFSQSLISWDAATLAPKNSVEGRASALMSLSEYYYNTLINEDVATLLKNLEASRDQLDELSKDKLDFFKEEYDRIACIPIKEYTDYQGLQARASKAWENAKDQSDFTLFEPFLQQVMDFQIKYVAYRGKGGHPYNTLLNDYERGLTVEVADQFFVKLREAIVPLVKKIQSTERNFTSPFKDVNFPSAGQEAFSSAILDKLGFNKDSGIIAESVHPFTLNLSRDDVRITTHYYEDNLLSSVYSTIHECGHALYEQNVAKTLGFSKLATGTTMGIHESQSRIYENNLARSEVFWNTYLPLLQKEFPDQLGNVDARTCYLGSNDVRPTLIRIEADELTYSLHIMVRYEIEKRILSGQLKAKDLPQVWNDLYEEYLGVRPENDSEGILQDVHWSEGLFGYFPSYALGSAYAAQFEVAMNKEFDVKEAIRSDNLSKIKEWLNEHIHRYGATKTPAEIILSATGEDFNPDYFINYLVDKYSDIYGL